MATLTRQPQKVFAGNADADQLAVFGTMKTGTPVYSSNLATLQSTAYTEGWDEAILDDKAPYLEEMNAVQYGLSYQIAYMLQKGIPDWLSTETYDEHDFCKKDNVIYYSLQNSNTGRDPESETTYWAVYADMSGKMDVDMSNMNPTTTAKKTIMGYMIPDWSNGITRSSTGKTQITYTCPNIGFVCYSTTVFGGSNTAYVKVNNVVVNRQNGKSNQICQELTGGFPVNAGDVVKVEPQYVNADSYLYFFPLKGV